MRTAQDNQGFTLLELIIALAVIGLLVAMALPSMNRMAVREDVREAAQIAAGVLRDARSRAIREGTQYFVQFKPSAGVLARIVKDVDADWQESGPDTARDVRFPPYQDGTVTAYGDGATDPHSSAATAPGDVSSTLSGVSSNGGATFPVDAVTTNRAVGFTPRGVPVALGTPTVWGSGSGAFYVTDSDQTVFATVLLPLGEVRVRGLNGASLEWK